MITSFKKVLSIIAIIVFLPGFIFAGSGGTIKGGVVDKKSGAPLALATIQVYGVTDSSKIITGAAADNNGNFEVSDIPFGSYNVKISYIGYSSMYIKNIVLSSDKKVKDIGIVKLNAGSEMTDVIEVTDDAPIMTVEADKKVFDVKRDLTSQSGSVLDVLKNLPTIDVDNDGNVSMRGNANVKILIDGKPSAMLANGTSTLQNVPANLVEKVELINNPSAKYEAEGVSGIINIIFKKNETTGFNGNVKSNAGTEDKYNISSNTNYKKGPLGVAFTYSFWNYTMPGTVALMRTNYFSDSSRYLNESLNWKYRGRSNYTSLGIDYDLDKTNTLSFILTGILFNRLRTGNANYSFLTSGNNPNFSYINNTYNEMSGYNLDFSATHTKKFSDKGDELTTLLSYSKRQENSNQDIANIIPTFDPVYNNQSNSYNFNFVNFQSDFTKSFGDNMNLESGIKFNLRKIDGQQDFYSKSGGIWVPNLLKNNNADAVDYIPAAYATYSYKIKDFTVKAGLRGEYTYINYKFQNNTLSVDRNYFDLFPSLSFSQKLGESNQFQLSYNRRINRPQLQQLNPFKDYTDPNTVMSGNPELNPEYNNSVELSYTRYLPIGSVTPTIFYRKSTDIINISQSLDSSGIAYVMPKNMGSTNSYGFELMIQGGFAKWWTYNLNGSYYASNLTGTNGIENIDRTDNSWSTRFNSNMAIPNLFDVQFTYMYYGRQYTVQGTIDPFQMMSLSFQKSFFDKKLVLGLRINDLMNQQKFVIAYNGTGFANDFASKPSSRAAFFTITYNFGNTENNSLKNKQQRKQREMEGEIQQSN